jgi:hypothetical protein
MGDPAIKVSGLKELRKALKQAGDDFPKQVAELNFTIVSDIVVPAAKEMAAQGFTNIAGHSVHPGAAVVNSIRALRQQKSAVIAFGSAKVPYAAGMEFGSMGGKGKHGGHTNQFGQWRGNKDGAGYFIWPVIRNKNAEIIERYVSLMGKLTSMAFNTDA